MGGIHLALSVILLPALLLQASATLVARQLHFGSIEDAVVSSAAQVSLENANIHQTTGDHGCLSIAGLGCSCGPVLQG